MECSSTLLHDNLPLVRQLILAFWGHILYTRGQIPLPLDPIISGKIFSSAPGNVIGTNDSSSRNNGMSRATRSKITKFITRFQSISASIDAILLDLERNSTHTTKQREITVVVMLGASATAPREAFVLTVLPTVHTSGSDETKQPSVSETAPQRAIDQAVRVLIRTLIGQWDTSVKLPPLTNTFIAIAAGCQSHHEHEQFSAAGAAEFNVREGFKVKLRKKSPEVMHLVVRSGENSSYCVGGDEELHSRFVVLKRGVKGLKN